MKSSLKTVFFTFKKISRPLYLSQTIRFISKTNDKTTVHTHCNTRRSTKPSQVQALLKIYTNSYCVIFETNCSLYW